VDAELRHLTGPSAPALWRYPPFRRLLVIGCTTSVSFNILLSAVPLWTAHHMLSRTSAGIPTAVMLLVAISIQPFIATLVTRVGIGTVQAAGLLALGVPSLFYGLATNLILILAISVVRGVGFAGLTVISTTLGAGLVPSTRHGESVAFFGLAVALPAVVAVPIGVTLTQSGHFMLVAIAGAVPALAVPLVPRVKNAPMRSWMLRRSGYSPVSRAKAWARIAPSALYLFAVTLAAGGLSAYLPVEWQRGRGAAVALLLVGGGVVLGRWPAGVLADRLGTSLLMPLSSIGAALGVGLIGAGLHFASAWVFVGAALFGVSLGGVQSLSTVVIFARASAGFESVASSLWNVSYDAGTAAGAAFVGMIAGAGLGIPFAVAVTAALIAITFPLTLERHKLHHHAKTSV
jgi:predicted MFS family arabinose efflux permease